MRHLTGLGFCLLPVLAVGHHSTAYFSDETRELVGVLTEVEWRNPHIALTLEVTNAQGEATFNVVIPNGLPTGTLLLEILDDDSGDCPNCAGIVDSPPASNKRFTPTTRSTTMVISPAILATLA